MTIDRFFMTAAFVLFTGLVATSLGMADTGPAEFVRTLGNEALGVIRADMTPAQKQAFFHQLLQQDDARTDSRTSLRVERSPSRCGQ